jgi:hypothetical protein
MKTVFAVLNLLFVTIWPTVGIAIEQTTSVFEGLGLTAIAMAHPRQPFCLWIDQ